MAHLHTPKRRSTFSAGSITHSLNASHNAKYGSVELAGSALRHRGRSERTESVASMASVASKISLTNTSGLGSQKIILLSLLMIAHFFAFVCYSLIAPFFPNEMIKKGGTATWASWVMSSYQLAMLVLSPLFGRLVMVFKARNMLLIGCFILGCSSVLFGFLDRSPDGAVFIVMCFLVRIVEGAGMSLYWCGSMTIIAATFQDNIGFVIGCQEVALGMGLTIGPVIGGALYDAGGFLLPFLASGLFFIALTFILCILIPSIEELDERQANFWAMLKIPAIAINGLAVISSSFNIGFFESVISLHVSDLVHGSALLVSLVLLLAGGFEGFAAPFWGKLCDKKVFHPKTIVAAGSLMLVVAYIFVGPLPFLGLTKTLWGVYVCSVLLGIGNGALLPVPLADTISVALEHGYPDNHLTYGFINGSFISLFGLGAFLGPLISGPLVDRFGFEWASLACVIVEGAIAVIFIVFRVFFVKNPKVEFDGVIEDEDSETKPMVGNESL